jgi:hypothetical protein
VLVLAVIMAAAVTPLRETAMSQGYAQACAFAGFDLERNTALSLMS